MDDPVLKRKLFANRARHVKQIQTGNVPGHYLGILAKIPGAIRMGTAAFKAARAMPKPPSGLITGGTQPSLAGRIMGQQKGLRTTGLGGLESKALRSGRIGRGGVTAAELGLSAPFAAEGVNQAITGAMEGDYGQVAGGLGTGLLSLPILGRSLRMAGIGAKGTGKIDQVRRAMAETGKKTQQLTSRKETLPAGLGLLGTGFAFDKGDYDRAVTSQVLSDPVDIAIKDYEKRNNVKLTDAEKAKVKQNLKSQTVPGAKSAEDRSSVPLEQKTNPSDKTPKLFKEGDLNEQEAIDLATKNSNAEEAGKKLKTLKTKDGQEFQKFYNDIENLTGKDDTNNLLLLKFASGLMTGKSGSEGLRGALDVAGQAATGTLDTMIALKAKEKERKNDLAVAYIKAKKDATNQFQVTGDSKTFLVDDPNAFNGRKTVQVKNFDSGPYKGYEAVKQVNADGSFTWRMANQNDIANGQELETSAASRRKVQNQLNGISLGYDMTKFVLGLPEDVIGPSGVVKSSLESVIGTADALITSSAGSNPDAYINTIFNTSDYRGIEGRSDAEEEALIKGQLKKDLEEARKITKADAKRFGFGRPNDEELALITKAKLVEVRLKYLIANANKAEDRLTQKDIEAAGKLTDIFRFDSPRKIRGNYVAILDDFNNKFSEVVGQAQDQGISNEYLLRFENMPMVQNHLNKKNQQQFNQNIGAIIDSIQIN